MKKYRYYLRSILFFYESRIAPLIAIYLGWLYWPIYRILKAYNVCFVVNIAGGTGHIICELDFFLRRIHKKELDVKKRYIWIRKNDPFSSTFVRFYKHNFLYAKASYLLYELTLPLTIRYKDITQDSGLSGLLWQLDNQGHYIRPIQNQNYLNLLPLSDLTPLWNHYFQLKNKTKNFYPLIKSGISWDLLESLVGERSQQRVLIHIKEKAANATTAPTDPKSYLEALQYLYSKKVQLVMVGREEMPACFRDFSVISYAKSSLANFAHDIALFQSCQFALIGGSGIAYLADAYQKPYLYLNSWHLATPVPSPLAIVVPTLLQKKQGAVLSFQEQIDLFLTTQSDGTVPGLRQYSPRNATSDEILAAVIELEELINHSQPRSPLQESMRMLGTNLPLYYAGSRYSEYFLRKHSLLFQ